MFQPQNSWMKNSTESTVDLGVVDDFEQNKHLFNSEALKVFQTQTNSMLYQYNESTNKYPEFYNTIELLGLLGLKSAYQNPLEGTFRREIARVFYFGFTCQKGQEQGARMKLIRAINDMAASGWLKASLCNLGSMELGTNPLFPSIKDRVAVFSYVAVKHDCEGHVENTYANYMFPEGGLPPEFK